MDVHSFLSWLEATPFAAMVRENGYLFPWVECAHVVALSLVVGSIAIVDLRLLGVASLGRPVTALLRQVLPLTWTAFGFAVATGCTLFSSDAVAYWDNPPFRFKLVAMGLAAVNMLLFHFVSARRIGEWSEAARTPWSAKIAGGVSMALWICVVASGRWIGFTVR
jgi:TctA family transporter